MKHIETFYNDTRPNAWGRDQTTTRERYQVETCDVGTVRPNYLGFQYKDYKFTEDDVGKVIETITYINSYASWAFCDISRGK